MRPLLPARRTSPLYFEATAAEARAYAECQSAAEEAIWLFSDDGLSLLRVWPRSAPVPVDLILDPMFLISVQYFLTEAASGPSSSAVQVRTICLALQDHRAGD